MKTRLPVSPFLPLPAPAAHSEGERAKQELPAESNHLQNPLEQNGEGESKRRERFSQSFKGRPGCDVDVDVLEAKVESGAGAGAKQAEDDGAAHCPAGRRHRGLLRLASWPQLRLLWLGQLTCSCLLSTWEPAF